MTKLKSIKSELAACREAFKANPGAKFAWCCHHEVPVEPLTETPGNRIEYILKTKHEGERALRFRNFRPVRVKLPEAYHQARQAYDQAWQACCQAWQACCQAWQARDQARQACDQARQACCQAWQACCQAGQACDQARQAYDQARQACDQAYQAYHQAGQAYDQACQACDQARQACCQAWQACKPELELLHTQDWPDNSWTGTSIFP